VRLGAGVARRRLRPGAAEIGATRSDGRYRRATLTFVAWIAVKAVALATLLASVPVSIAYLGSERFGVWTTAVSAAGLLSFATLGFDRGLLNALAAADASDNQAAARRLVSTAFFLLGTFLAALLVAFAGLYPVLPWARLLNVAPTEAGDAGPVMAALIGCDLVLLLGSITETVQSAYQEGFLGGLWDAVGKLLALVALVAAIALGASLPRLVLAVAAAPILAALANSAMLFAWRRPWLVPRLSLVRRRVARQLFAAGSLFFLSQLALTVAYYADNLIVAELAGSEAVAGYAATQRLFDVPGMLLQLVGAALWPSLAEAISRADLGWAERGLKHLILVSLALAAVTALPLMVLGPRLLDWWVGRALWAPPSLFIAFGLFWLLSALTQPISVFLNAANALRFQLVCLAALAVGSLAVKFGLAQFLGPEGVAWGRVVAEALFRLLPYALFLPGVMRTLRAKG